MDRADLAGAHAVANRAGVERQPEPLLPSTPHLLDAGDIGDVIVLHPRQMPDEPGDAIAGPVDTHVQLLGRQVLHDVVNDATYPIESICHDVRTVHQDRLRSLGASSSAN